MAGMPAGYGSLEPYAFYFHGGGNGSINTSKALLSFEQATGTPLRITDGAKDVSKTLTTSSPIQLAQGSFWEVAMAIADSVNGRLQGFNNLGW